VLVINLGVYGPLTRRVVGVFVATFIAMKQKLDTICDGENIVYHGIMEHIEPCGVHSGE
jgi:hypothetical protein